MSNSPELKALIRKNADLFWYIKDEDKENLDLSVVLEFFLNYASLEDVKTLFDIVGIQNAADEFRRQINLQKERSNYFPEYKDYFTRYFEKYAS